jgi:AraC-like DNA-binding protein
MGPEETFDEYWDACSGFVDVRISDDRARSHGAEVSAWRLDNIVFIEGKLGPHTVSRTRKHVAAQNSEFIAVGISSGNPVGSYLYDGKVYSHAPDLVLHDFSRSYTEVVGWTEFFLAYIPHGAVGYDPARHDPVIGLSAESPVGRVLMDALLSLRGELSHTRQSEASALAAGFSGLVSALMLRNNGEESGAYKVARLKRMRDFIEANLRDSNLGLETLSAAVGASRSTIYRDFSGDRGLDRYGIRRRLQRAYIDLVDQPATRGRITQIAEDWGFESISHFYRLFRAEFGCAPGDIAAVAATGSTGDSLHSGSTNRFERVASWLLGV